MLVQVHHFIVTLTCNKVTCLWYSRMKPSFYKCKVVILGTVPRVAYRHKLGGTGGARETIRLIEQLHKHAADSRVLSCSKLKHPHEFARRQ